jgi:hypothetical protein
VQPAAGFTDGFDEVRCGPTMPARVSPIDIPK